MTDHDSTDELSECGKALDMLAERMENGGLEPERRSVDGYHAGHPWAEWHSNIAELMRMLLGALHETDLREEIP